MGYGGVIVGMIGLLSTSSALVVAIKRHGKQQRRNEKLRMISQTLQHAEETLWRFQERHDRILAEMCSYYLVNHHLEEALAAARAAMDQALDFVVRLRNMQVQILRSFPDEVDFLRMD